MSLHPVVFAVAAFALVVAGPRLSAAAPVYIVNSTADVVAAPPLDSGPCETAPGNNVCTLRAAIMKANHTPGGGATIRFGLPGVITHVLSIPRVGDDREEKTGSLYVTANMTIEGNGSGNTIIDGNGSAIHDRVLAITNATVIIRNLTVQNGESESGGGIANGGTLTIERSIIRNNKATSGVGPGVGGGIANAHGLVLRSVTVASNSASQEGGGIHSEQFTSLQIVDSTVSGNASNAAGGGLWTRGFQTSIVRSTISGNVSGSGAGIKVRGGTLNVVDSTLSGNFAVGDGGGLLAEVNGNVNLINSTVALNIANFNAVGVGRGGGIFADAGPTVTLTNSIVSNNFYRAQVPPAMAVIPVNNECKGTVSTAGPNLFLFNDPANCTINGGATFGDPKLTGLAANGGPTMTLALGAGSAAIDAGAAGGCTDPVGGPLATDQRGAPRPSPAGGRCDLGAYEVGPLFTLDVDASVSATRYNAPTDGMLILRHLFGLTGSALTTGVTGATATRTDPGVIKSLLDGNRVALDVDSNGVADALTDGLLIVRHLFGVTGSALTSNAVGYGAERNTPSLIEAYLQTLKP